MSKLVCYGINLKGKSSKLHSIAFVLCHVALVPLRKKKK